MEKVKILIVEDEMLTATDIMEKLESFGYEITGIAQTAGEALLLAKTTNPDIILLDIILAGKKDGIDAAEMIRDVWNGPFIFLTGNSEKQMVEKAKKVLPSVYLFKPFNVNEFTINIDIAIHNFISQYADPTYRKQKFCSDAIFIPVDYAHQKIMKKDIILIEASGSYIHIKTVNSNYTISTNLGNMAKQINDDVFVRVSRKHIVNVSYIDRIEGNRVMLQSDGVIVGESYKQDLLKRFQFIKTK